MHLRLSLRSQLHFQYCACHLCLYFHSQVNTNVLSKCTPKNVLPKCMVKFISKASSLLTSSHSGQACHCDTSLFVVQYSCSCELDTGTLPRVLCVECPRWAWFCSWLSVSLYRPAQRCHTRNSTSFLSIAQGLTLDTATRCHTGSHSNSFLSCLWRKSPAQLSSSLLPGATIYCV